MNLPIVSVSLVDTDVMVDIQHKVPNALAWFASVTSADIAVPGFVAMELEQSARNSREAYSSRRLIRSLPIVWPHPADLSAALSDFRALHLSHGIGMMDCMIAATARGLGATLFTFNSRHFSAIPGLVIHQPYKR
jgi:predicted nucleic acid-binding protein